MAFPKKDGLVVDSVYFNGYKYNRYPNSTSPTHRRYYTRSGGQSLHRAVWEFANGAIPDGWHIHHKDGNFLNNQLDNLECIPKAEHFEHHREDITARSKTKEHLGHLNFIRGKAAEWHRSEEGRAWHRSHAYATLSKTWTAPKVLKEYDITCKKCSKLFIANARSARFCSTDCWSKDYNERRRAKAKEARGTSSCRQCQVTYKQKRSNQYFCCTECKTKFNNAKKYTRV